MKLSKNRNLFDADDWAVDPEKMGTPLHLRRRLAPSLSRELRFLSPKSVHPKELFFIDETRIDNQATRGVRELTHESAVLLEKVILVTDETPRDGRLLTVTSDMLHGVVAAAESEYRGADEVTPGEQYAEGNIQRVIVNRYERDPRVRAACIAKHGAKCFICRFDFGARYGEEMDGLIHVHHLVPLSTVGENGYVDPVRDLRPLCPNCHAVVHRREPPYTPDEVRAFLEAAAQRR